jgi:tetratricopeptide (TPR) repeat protein
MTGSVLLRIWLFVSLCSFGTVFLRAQDTADTDAPDTDTSPYHQALINYKSGKYPAARIAIEQAAQADPENLAVAVLKARILTELGEYAAGDELLHHFLGPQGPVEVQIALGDLYLRARKSSAAANMYQQALATKAGDPDVTLHLIYAEIDSADLVAAGKYASELKPLDPLNPAYYFARAGLAQTTGNTAEADQDIQTARTIYGNTVADRYLRTYLQVFSGGPKTGLPATPNPHRPKDEAPSKT